MNNLMEINGLSKRFPGFALEDINLTLEPGCIMGFVGANGAGKSTTIKLILNLLHKDGGDVKLFGLDNVRNEIEAKQRIGFVLDDFYLYEGMTVAQAGSLAAGFYDTWDVGTYGRYLDQFQLLPKKRIKELSTGMKAKLSMAMALSHGAQLLILDEPTSGLDPVVRSDLLLELYEVVKDPSRSVFLSTHITSDLDKVADNVTFIHDGRIALSTTRDEIDERYAVVKGSKAMLGDIKDKLLRYRESSFGFEGLTDQAARLRKLQDGGLVVEKAKIEDILLMIERGVAAC